MKKAILAFLETNPPQHKRRGFGLACSVTAERPVSRETSSAIHAALEELIAEGKVLRTGNGKNVAYITTKRALELRAAYVAAVKASGITAPVS